MKKLLSLFLAVIIIFSLSTVAFADDYPYAGTAYGVDFDEYDKTTIQKGDSIALIGDSITHGTTKGDNKNVSWFVQLDYYLITRFPELRAKTVNFGVASINTGKVAQYQLKTEISSHDYNKVIMYIGTNDCGSNYQTNKSNIMSSYYQILNFFEDKNTDVIALLGLPGLEEETLPPNPGHRQAALKAMSTDIIEKIAEQRSIPFAAQYDVMQDTIAASDVYLFQDGLHPNAAGSAVTFASLVEALKLPGEVATVEINGREVAKQSNCTVSGLAVSKNAINFTYLANALPLAQTDYVAQASQIMDYIGKFSRETLKITDIAQGTYDVTIDGEVIGTFTSEELAQGVNLANYNTPMIAQSLEVADEVFKLTELTREIRELARAEAEARYVGATEETLFDTIKKEALAGNANSARSKDYLRKTLEKSMDEYWIELDTLWESCYDLAQPKAHKFEIRAKDVDGPITAEPDTPTEPTEPDVPTTPEEPKNNTGLYIGIAAAVAIAVAFMVIVIKTKKRG